MSDVLLALDTSARWDHMSPPTVGNLQQQIRNLDDKHDQAHDRLRKDLDALAVELSNARELVAALRSDVNLNATRNPNISAIGFSTNQVIAVVLAVLGLAGGFYKLAENQSETNRQQAEIIQRQTETTTAVQALQADSIRRGQQIESLQATVILQKGTK